MENQSIVKVKTVFNPPVKLNFIDFVNCPVCEFEIDLKDKIVDDKSFVLCDNCNHKINFKISII